MIGKWIRGFGYLPFIVTVFILFSFTNDINQRKKKVLVIHSYHQGLLWTDDITKGINSVFGKRGDIEVHTEYLDSKRNIDSVYFKELYRLYKLKHRNIKYDAILVSDNNALYFVRDHREEFFKDVPLVFCAIDQFSDSLIRGMNNITGVTEEIDFKKTVEIMLALHPDVRNIVIVNDNQSVSAKINRQFIKDFWPSLNTKVNYSFLENMTIPELLTRINKLDDSNIILLTNFTRDSEGNYISYQENIELIKGVTSLPIYSGWDFYLGKGIVGGMLTSGFDEGRLAAECVVKVIDGVDPDSIPIIRSGYNHWKFDYSQLVKHVSNLDVIPKNSVIINRPPNFYQKNKNILIVAALLVILFSSLLLENEARNRRKAKQLKETNKELDRRVDEKTKALKDANILLEDQKQKIVRQNKELEKHRNNLLELVRERTIDLENANEKLRAGRARLLMMLDVSSDGAWEYNYSEDTFKLSDRTWERLGYSKEEVSDKLDFVDSLLHPDDKNRLIKNRMKYVLGKKGIYNNEYRIKSRDGKWIWLLSRGKILEYSESGYPKLIVGTHTDITDIKIAEEQLKKEEKRLRDSEKRWRSLFEKAQEEILVLDNNGNILDANIAACSWLGFTQEGIKLLNISDIDKDHSSFDFKSLYLDKLNNFNSSISFDSVQIRKDGSDFPVAVNLNYVEFEESKMILAIVSDLSRRKETEREVLNAIISTEENERSRLARDLHDTIGPLLSSIKLYLSTLFKTQSQERKVKLLSLSEEAINEAVSSVRQITNNLSPQALADYGIVSALSSFVQKINTSSQIKTEFKVSGFEYRVPKEVELAIYRVATELMNNTIKHSGAKKIFISLENMNGEVVMIYKDNGKGVIKDNSMELSKGRGIRNINIRLKSLNGIFTITSEPDWGFVANIRIPLKIQSWINKG